MRNAMLSTPQSIKPRVAPETPYLKAKQEWDFRIGTSAVQAKNWRIACISSLLLSGLLTGVIFFQASQSKVIPVVVGLDKDTGEAKTLGVVTKDAYSPGPLEIKYFLSEFVRYVRAVPLDEVVIKQNWLKAYSFMRTDASGLLNEMTEKDEESPLKQIGKIIVSVQPISVVQIPETSSYQVRWKETQYSTQGQKIKEYTMQGTFLTELSPPKNEEAIAENPLGLYIKSFQWNREL